MKTRGSIGVANWRPFGFLALDANHNKVCEIADGWARAGYSARVVGGSRMRNLDGVFDEFARVFEFPPYFGRNKDAFSDCLSELENVAPGKGLMVLVDEANHLLEEDDVDTLRWLAQTFSVVTQEWGSPVEDGEWWDRPAVSFDVVLAVPGPPNQLLRRWSALGYEITEIHPPSAGRI